MIHNNETVSVIIPIYNARRFIKKCITSVLDQTYSDLQLLLIDDGSTDNSLNICKKFAKKDSRILLLSQINKGVSAARNLGLEHITGKYVTFVDADDWLPKDALSNMLSLMLVNSADFVVGNMLQVEPTANTPEDIISLSISSNCQNNSVFVFFNDMGYYAHVAKKLLRADIILKNDIVFPENIKCGEDSCFMLDYLSHCSKAVSTDKIIYYNNRLFNGTGGTRYYPNRQEWSFEVLKRYNECTRHFCDESTSDILLCKEAIRQTNRVNLKHMMCGEPTSITYGRVKETYSLLDKFITDVYLQTNSDDDDVAFYTSVKESLKSVECYDIIANNIIVKYPRGIICNIKNSIKNILAKTKYLILFKIL